MDVGHAPPWGDARSGSPTKRILALYEQHSSIVENSEPYSNGSFSFRSIPLALLSAAAKRHLDGQRH